MNYFEMFGLEQKYHLDMSLLDERYFDLHKKYHPDVNDCDMTDMLHEINDAYNVLKDNMMRARYIFEINKMICDRDVPEGVSDMFSDAQRWYSVKFAEMELAFERWDLTAAYHAWLACKYLSRYVSVARE